MRKIIESICIFMLLGGQCFATTDALKKTEIVSETVATVSTTAKFVSIPDCGNIEIFAHGKMYITILGTTPNVSSRYLNAGGSLDIQAFRYTSQSIGVLADSGTVTYNITVYKYTGE